MFVIRYWSEGKKKPQLIDLYMNYGFDFKLSAVRTGLEPATHGVTGRYSNQLNYRTKLSNTGRYSNPENSGNYRTNCKTSCKINLIFYSAKLFSKILSVNI